MSPTSWAGRRVFVTGHTGFMGSWLSLWLTQLGADVSGFSLAPPTSPSLFELAGVAGRMRSTLGDVRDAPALRAALAAAAPDVVVHLAAQPLVRRSYREPVDTYATNVLGTAHLLDAVRLVDSVRAVLVMTSDKCYANRGWAWGYRERDRLGGADPYSSSKACAELVCAAYRESYFTRGDASRRVALATVRAGNVLGGGDWAEDRLVPDFVRARIAGEPLAIRCPDAVRPWQHVLEPLHGILLLADALCDRPETFAGAWNLGPAVEDAWRVRDVIDRLARAWGAAEPWVPDGAARDPEAHVLRLDATRARTELGWAPRWSLDHALTQTARWYRAWHDGEDVAALTLDQIRAHRAGSTEESR